MNVEATERISKTYEVKLTYRNEQNYINRTLTYRFWEVGDGDWKIILLDSDDDASKTNPSILLPKVVIDKIINANVKTELKK